ncbi:MAG: T9SS type A sorting domain-containing protein [Vicingus serpentipes]|nr:T9SS type A sorting domain-containing protein [Vicingus serpentipes]
MNIKTIIFGCVAVGIAATGGLMIKLQKINNEAIYTPRSADEELSKGFAGYAEYIHSLRANQITGEIDMDAYNKAKQEVFALNKISNKALNMTWEQKGPDNVGGRTRAILVDKDNPNIVYAGSIAGGLFVSTNGGGTWSPVAEMADNLAISCITQTSTGRIFFGTGCSFETINGTSKGTPGFTGNGVYEYIPSTQTAVPVLVNTGTVPNNNGSETALNIVNAIAAKGERLYIGTADGMLYADPTAGVYPTTTAGWFNPIYIVFPTLKQVATVNDIDIASNGSMVVCFNNKVYHSFSDADNSFTETIFSGTNRISAAIAPTDPNYIYLLTSKSNGGSDELEGVYLSKSFDGSNLPVFEKVIPGGAKSIDPFLQNGGTGNGQGVYDACIAVDPSNKNRCIIGGVQLYELNIIPNSSPIGGDWTKTAHLSEPLGAPYYMHADKHTIFWKDANTVYIGTDGGVFKSTNGGTNWAEKNLGYNVTTFFSVAHNELGWVLGGSQDNGCQLVGFGDLGTPGPLNAVEVTGGDGFTVEFSSLAGGIAYTTSQYGKLYRTLLGGGGAATFYDGELSTLANCSNNSCSSFNTTIQYWESSDSPSVLTSDSIEIKFNGTDTLYPGQWYPYTSLSNGSTIYYNPSDTIPVDTNTTLMWPDYIQHKMAFGGISGAVYLTRQASNLGAPIIDWIKIAGDTSKPNAFSGSAQVMQFSPDGNTLFVGASGGSLYRIDNLSAGGGYSVIDSTYIANDSIKLDYRSPSHVTTCTRIETWPGRAITGIAVDPNNGNNLVVTLGNYGNTNYVYRSTDALGTGTFTSIQGPASPGAGYLPRMPVYDAEIDFIDNNKVIIGTEWGVFGSDNAFGPAGAVQWNQENNGLAHVPVFEVRQESKYNLTDSDGNYLSGMYYLGTHGKGFYTSSTFTTGINDPYKELVTKNDKFVSNLNVYPNPLNNVGNISFNLKDNAKTIANIYNLTGKLVKTVDFGPLSKGEHNERFDASSLSIGTYILSVESGNNRSVAKFIVTH